MVRGLGAHCYSLGAWRDILRNLSRIQPMNAPAECLNCGVCCFSKSATYVQVSASDIARLGDAAERVTRLIGKKAYMRMEAGHCHALQISHRRGQPAVFFCALYQTRPQICRDLKRESAECMAELCSKGQRVMAEYGS